MANRSRSQSDKSTGSITIAGTAEMEYFWSIELNSEKRTLTWAVNTDDLDEDDEDYIEHTVFLKLAVLGPSAVANEMNIVTLESVGADGEMKKGAIVSLTKGLNNMTQLDLTLPGKLGGTFTLAEGSGPVIISGNHLLECPKDDSADDNQTESELSMIEAEIENVDDDDDEEGEEEESKEEKKNPKRKAGLKANKQKKAKMEIREDEKDDDDDDDVGGEDDDDEEDEDDDDEDEDYEEETFKKSKKNKEQAKKSDKGKSKQVIVTKTRVKEVKRAKKSKK